MSQSAQMAVRNALMAVLQAAPALADGRIVGNRRRPMASEHATQIYVYLEDSPCTHEIIGTTDWRTRIRVECLARTSAGSSAEDAADALGVAVFARVMSDPSLGGAAIDTTALTIAWSEDEADNLLGACQQLFTVWHATPDNSIAA